MTFEELRKKYTEDELSYFPGDAGLRFDAFSPILSDLYEDKIVYCERFVAVVSLRDIELSPKGFGATCTPFLAFERPGDFRSLIPDREWSFRGPWDWMRLIKNSINVPYAGWTIWPEKDRVKEVIRSLSMGDLEAALKLTLKEPEKAG
ncbi:hypothetical protein OJ996_23205 [Luteolibacter sp. GHJ8]|uniref:Uncharacterized protein n=1 Tax=Luteolibacter rhizosphaerae TaxID=2989719 RepID=A0ABT3GAJ9_9BACT|nr:hypothetical protein [Luteolibacter rhizosphaerae]MCW1916514.1 hypothetical protein [Luteolibacter rhizosphaerae]